MKNLVIFSGICLKTVDSPVIPTQAEPDMDWKGDEVFWKGMEDVFWDGMVGGGGWNERSKDTPHDVFICIGMSLLVIVSSSTEFLTCLKCYSSSGTNDQGWGGDKNEFVEHYATFLTRLRDSYSGEVHRIHVIVRIIVSLPSYHFFY